MSLMRIGRLDVDILGSRLILAGRLDDRVSLGEVPPRLGPGPIIIDTAAVTFINSIGMREWSRLVRALVTAGLDVRLERVSEVLLAQINLFRDLSRMAAVVSFHAPYECSACGAESSPLILVEDHLDALRHQTAPALPCPECGSAMQLADFPERYLSIFKA